MTQNITILQHLEQSPLTPLDALMKYGCFQIISKNK
jgi:hypothetical protein